MPKLGKCRTPLRRRAGARRLMAVGRPTAAGSAEPRDLSLFGGHTWDEQYIFYNTSVWFLVPAALITFPSQLGWTLRSFEIALWSPWVGVLNVIFSLTHWTAYTPGSWRQQADVLLAGLVISLILRESVALWTAESITPFEAGLLATAWPLMFALVYLDMFHKVHSHQASRLARRWLNPRAADRLLTTHVTGTRIHVLLRWCGLSIGLVNLGYPSGGSRAGGALCVCASTLGANLAHAALCHLLSVPSWARSYANRSLSLSASVGVVSLWLMGVQGSWGIAHLA